MLPSPPESTVFGSEVNALAAMSHQCTSGINVHHSRIHPSLHHPVCVPASQRAAFRCRAPRHHKTQSRQPLVTWRPDRRGEGRGCPVSGKRRGERGVSGLRGSARQQSRSTCDHAFRNHTGRLLFLVTR